MIHTVIREPMLALLGQGLVNSFTVTAGVMPGWSGRAMPGSFSPV